MKQWSREQIMKGLQELIPEIIFHKKSDNFDDKYSEIWTSGDCDCIFKGLPPFDHSLEYGNFTRENGMKVESMYVNGVHREIYSWLEERGWHPKWYDGGTLFFWKEFNQNNII